jgi:hypothetical protein
MRTGYKIKTWKIVSILTYFVKGGNKTIPDFPVRNFLTPDKISAGLGAGLEG